MEVDRVAWSEFRPHFYREWAQDEHVAVIGQTRSGKTTLAQAILPRRSFVAAVVTKPEDPTLDRWRRAQGWTLARDWPPPQPRRPVRALDGRLAEHRVMLWPKLRTVADVAKQQRVIADALQSIFTTGRWCVYLDEVRYVAGSPLNLKHLCELLWVQGAGLKVPVVAGTQRPRWVPRELFSESQHFFIFRLRDDDDLRRLSDMGGDTGLDPRELRAVVRTQLDKHEALYVGPAGDLAITRVDP